MKLVLAKIGLNIIKFLFFIFSWVATKLNRLKIRIKAYVDSKVKAIKAKQRGNLYGWVPDIPDSRDKLFATYNPAVPEEQLPASVDLREFCSPVENQLALGSCTANALVGAVEFLENKDKKPFKDFSRLFLYYNERKIEGSINSDSGAQIRDGVKSLNTDGICSEISWPYIISKFTKKPSCACYSEAKKYQILTYQRVNNTNINEIKTALASGYPVVFGFSVYESFESEEVAKTGVAPMPQSNEKLLGGHAVLCVGYDNATQRFLVRNSWGTGWGMQGYFTLPFQYLTSSSLADDFWFIKTAENI